MANIVSIQFQVDQDSKGRTTLKQIDTQIDNLGKTSQKTGSQVDSLLAGFKAALVVEFFRRGAVAAFEFGQAAVKAFNDARAASLALESIAKFKGIDPQAAKDTVANLDLVKNGLLSAGEASKAMQAILRRTSDLETAGKLLRAFGDNAAFGKQAGLSFGEAVVSQAEGYKQLNNQLLDNGGLTTNASILIGQYGFKLEDLDDATKKVAATTALNNAILNDSAANFGNASKLSAEYAGGQAKLEAAQQKILVQIGEMITKNPALNDSFRELGKSLEIISKNLQDTDSELSKFVRGATGLFAAFVLGLAEVAGKLETILFLSQSLTTGGLIQAITGIQIFSQADPAQQKILDDAKKFSAALSEALKPKPGAVPAPPNVGASAEAKKNFEAGIKQIEEFKKKTQEIEGATNDLQTKLSLNPLGLIYDAAIAKHAAFMKNLGSISPALDKLAQKGASLDFFKGALTQAQTLTNNLNEMAKLNAGFGGADIKDKKIADSLAFEERKLELIKQGVNVQGLGTLRELEGQALLFELQTKRAAGTLSNAEQLALINKIELTDKKFASQAKFEAISASALEANIQSALDFAAKATDDVQKQFANQQILGLTADIGKLTPGQVDVRQKALADELTLNQAAFLENGERLASNTAAMENLNKTIDRLATKEGLVKIIIDPFLDARVAFLPSSQ